MGGLVASGSMIRSASCVWELPDADHVSCLPAGPALAFAAGLAGVGSPGSPRSPRQRRGRCTGLDGVLCAVRGGRAAQCPLRPSMMVKVLLYAYATGTFSSRAVARKRRRMWRFGCSRRATARNIERCGEFRRRHLGEFSELLVQVVQVAREMGLARFGKLSIDGTKVRANASKRKAMSYDADGPGGGSLAGGDRGAADRRRGRWTPKKTSIGASRVEWYKTRGCAATNCPRSCRREKRLAAIQAAKARLEAAQRARDDEHGREPGQDRNCRGGRPFQARLRRARAVGAEQFHRSPEPDHEDQQ